MALKFSSSEDFVTLMIVPHGRVGNQSIQLRLPYLSRRQLLGIGLVMAVILLSIISYSLLATYRLANIARLVVEHRTQEQKLMEYSAHTAELEAKLDKFIEKEQVIRSALGLAPPAPSGATAVATDPVLNQWRQDVSNVSPKVRMIVQKLNSRFFQLQSSSNLNLERYGEITARVHSQPERFENLPSIWPVSGAIFSGFGFRIDPITRRRAFHKGMDIAAAYRAPVRATAAGYVEKSGWDGGYGYMVKINHGFGYCTLYGHNARLLAKPGQKVSRGQTIALAGSTGMSTGVHVHYEVQRFGIAVSPGKYLNMNTLTTTAPI